MITEAQADKIIELLTKIDSTLESIESNTGEISSIDTDVRAIRKLLADKNS